MGLLRNAAIAWSGLYEKEYQLLLGLKGRWSRSVRLIFLPEHFHHLAGFQYADDIDFGVRPSELRKTTLTQKLIDGVIDDRLIEKSIHWTEIQPRLLGIARLEEGLDSEFRIYRYYQNHVHGGTRISAEFVVKSAKTDVTFFVFIDNDTGNYFCRSIFSEGVVDYSAEQPSLTVLKKEKLVAGNTVYLQVHPGYKPELDQG